MRSTPATREFTDEPVPDDVLFGILDAARFAPSGGNRQAWHVIVLQDPEVRRRIRDLYVLGWREYMAHVVLGKVAFAADEEGRWTGPPMARVPPGAGRFTAGGSRPNPLRRSHQRFQGSMSARSS